MRRLLIAAVSPFMAFLFLNTYINFSNTYLKENYYPPIIDKKEIAPDTTIYAGIDNITELSRQGLMQ